MPPPPPGNARIEHVGKPQSCMVSKFLVFIWQMELDKYAAWKDFSTADHSLFMPATSHSSATSGGGSAGGGGAQMLADGVARV